MRWPDGGPGCGLCPSEEGGTQSSTLQENWLIKQMHADKETIIYDFLMGNSDEECGWVREAFLHI